MGFDFVSTNEDSKPVEEGRPDRYVKDYENPERLRRQLAININAENAAGVTELMEA